MTIVRLPIFKYPLTILFTLLLLLNILDYLTTIYALENIPNVIETNPRMQTYEAMFRFKILYGIPSGIAGILAGFSFDELRSKYKLMFVRFYYLIMLAVVFAVFIHYVFVVVNNIYIILRYS